MLSPGLEQDQLLQTVAFRLQEVSQVLTEDGETIYSHFHPESKSQLWSKLITKCFTLELQSNTEKSIERLGFKSIQFSIELSQPCAHNLRAADEGEPDEETHDSPDVGHEGREGEGELLLLHLEGAAGEHDHHLGLVGLGDVDRSARQLKHFFVIF